MSDVSFALKFSFVKKTLDKIDSFFTPLITSLHKKTGIIGDHFSLLQLISGTTGALLLVWDKFWLSFLFIFLGRAFDGLDGMTARILKTDKLRGVVIDHVADKVFEIIFILALVVRGEVSLFFALIVLFVINISFLFAYIAGLDLGLKGIMLVAGYIFGFKLALYFILWTSLLSIAVDLIIIISKLFKKRGVV